MSSHDKPGSGEPEWRRRKRLDSVFGDDLPEQITDPGERVGRRGRDSYEQDRPPHWG